MPIWAEFSITPSNKTSLIATGRPRWMPSLTKLKENVTSLAGVPSWMLVLLNKMLVNLEREFTDFG
jgi:hypothetical protein